jgi:hypothetical protein
MNLTPNDILGMDSKVKEYRSEYDEQDSFSSIESSEVEGYNSNWTLRKCCSKFLDKVSGVFPQPVLDVIKPYLEENMQNSEWNIK